MVTYLNLVELVSGMIFAKSQFLVNKFRWYRCSRRCVRRLPTRYCEDTAPDTRPKETNLQWCNRLFQANCR